MLLSPFVSSVLALSASAQGCQPAEFDLIGAQNFTIGEVTFSNTVDTLRIDVDIAAHHKHHHNGRIHAVHIYAGLTPPQPNGGGNYAPGQFPYKTDYAPNYVTSHTEWISFMDLGAVCGDTVHWAVHADVWCDIHGEETAWAQGQTPFSGGQWGWTGTYDLCCNTNAAATLDLSVGAMQPGAPVTFEARNALPGETVRFFRTRGLIVPGGGATHPALGATVLDLQGPVLPIGSAIADAGGTAALTMTLPVSLPADAVIPVQAVALRATDAAVSNAEYCFVQ